MFVNRAFVNAHSAVTRSGTANCLRRQRYSLVTPDAYLYTILHDIFKHSIAAMNKTHKSGSHRSAQHSKGQSGRGSSIHGTSKSGSPDMQSEVGRVYGEQELYESKSRSKDPRARQALENWNATAVSQREAWQDVISSPHAESRPSSEPEFHGSSATRSRTPSRHDSPDCLHDTWRDDLRVRPESWSEANTIDLSSHNPFNHIPSSIVGCPAPPWAPSRIKHPGPLPVDIPTYDDDGEFEDLENRYIEILFETPDSDLSASIHFRAPDRGERRLTNVEPIQSESEILH